ncbi:MAG: M23 family metallopeptidase [Bryobacteraceae bacterium]|nr:M23 family metallopeptidase [Bryobacteraceae bacterium]
MLALAVLVALQGNAVFLDHTPDGSVAARLAQRSVPLFSGQGIMPIPVDHPAGQQNIEFLSSSGTVLGSRTIEVRKVAFPQQNIVIDPSKKQIEPSPGEREAVSRLRETLTPVRRFALPFTPPVRGCMNSPFGVARLHNGQPSGNYHRGVDQRSPHGRPVRAAAAGVVRISRMFNLHGGTIGLDHGQGVTSLYLHLSRFAVKEGHTVKQGDIVGYIGATGFATGPHLHWQVHVHGVPVNPLQWVKLTPCATCRECRLGG